MQLISIPTILTKVANSMMDYLALFPIINLGSTNQTINHMISGINLEKSGPS